MEIREFEFGVFLNSGSSNNTISGNKITENAQGILLEFSSDNTINGNNITINYGAGIELDYSSNNTIIGNNITNNDIGILFYVSSFDNAIYHNNFIGNTQQVYDYSWDHQEYSNSINSWDDGYPSGGNYWSNYTGVDSNHDGIGDTTHVIDANNTDRYPLMYPWGKSSPVGGINIPVNKLALLAPYIALASTILVATAATAIYVKRVKRRKKKQLTPLRLISPLFLY